MDLTDYQTSKYILNELGHVVAQQDEVQLVDPVKRPEHVGRQAREVVYDALVNVTRLGVFNLEKHSLASIKAINLNLPLYLLFERLYRVLLA